VLAHAFARVEAARLARWGTVTLAWGMLLGVVFFGELRDGHAGRRR
jgi:hypothetical protein